ncbi:MAG: ribbon-helix-helix protein, CopG family [Acidimicrobiia bacterium]|nr:ribbon-helix-helix protein, CopG family [Acidimicrobiia bacterium]
MFGSDEPVAIVRLESLRGRDACSAFRYVDAVAQAISVRLDDDALRALRALEAAGMSRSEAIRSALVESARRLRRSSELAAEVAALEVDEADRAEMLAVAGLMESLRAPR